MKVLIADDHGIVRTGIRLLLERQPDVEVIGEAADGVQAVEEALASHPDLCILDVGMPRMTGLQAARAARGTARSGCSALPVGPNRCRAGRP